MKPKLYAALAARETQTEALVDAARECHPVLTHPAKIYRFMRKISRIDAAQADDVAGYVTRIRATSGISLLRIRGTILVNESTVRTGALHIDVGTNGQIETL